MSQAGAIDVSGGTGGGGITEIVADVGTAAPIAGIINIVGGTGISTSASGNTITINFTGITGITWQVVTSASNPITLAPSNGYITKGAGSVQFILPAAASVGDEYKIVGYGNLWTIAQNANQDITLGFLTTTTGVGGSMTATSIKDCVDIVCVTTNLEFIIPDSVGNPTIV